MTRATWPAKPARRSRRCRLARFASSERGRAESLLAQYPELLILTWLDDRRRVRASYAAPSLPTPQLRAVDTLLRPGGDTESTFSLARDLQQPVYAQPASTPDSVPLLQLHIPLSDRGHFAGVLLAEYSNESLLRYGVPAEVLAKYAVALLNGNGQVLAGNAGTGLFEEGTPFHDVSFTSGRESRGWPFRRRPRSCAR